MSAVAHDSVCLTLNTDDGDFPFSPIQLQRISVYNNCVIFNLENTYFPAWLILNYTSQHCALAHIASVIVSILYRPLTNDAT